MNTFLGYNLNWYFNYDVNSGRFISLDMYPYYHILPWSAVILYYLMLIIVPKIIKKGLKIDFIITVWNFFCLDIECYYVFRRFLWSLFNNKRTFIFSLYVSC